MRKKGMIWFFFFLSLLIILMGCGRKAPPTLPEKPSSLSLEFQTKGKNLCQRICSFSEISDNGIIGVMEYWSSSLELSKGF